MRISTIVLGMLLLAGCAGIRTQSSFDPGANFSEYRTFCWIDGCEENYSGPSSADQREKMQMLKSVIKEVLEEKGYVNDSISTDLLVGFHVTVIEKEVVVNPVSALPVSPYADDISYWNGYSTYLNEDVQRFLKGTLVIDLIDAEAGAAIWQGMAERYMETNPQINREKMKRAIKKVFKDFPPDSPK